MGTEHSCGNCELGSPTVCNHICQPPSPEHPYGVDGWKPRHYTTARHWDDVAQAWVLDSPDSLNAVPPSDEGVKP